MGGGAGLREGCTVLLRAVCFEANEYMNAKVVRGGGG